MNYDSNYFHSEILTRKHKTANAFLSGASGVSGQLAGKTTWLLDMKYAPKEDFERVRCPHLTAVCLRRRHWTVLKLAPATGSPCSTSHIFL